MLSFVAPSPHAQFSTLTTHRVPCSSRFAVPRESERQRIEAQNPNPKMPMVRYMGGTWRVGGLLALSRAFGDSYLKVGRGGALQCTVCGTQPNGRI